MGSVRRSENFDRSWRRMSACRKSRVLRKARAPFVTWQQQRPRLRVSVHRTTRLGRSVYALLVIMRVPKIPKRTREIYVGRTAFRRIVEALERLENPKGGASPWWVLVALLLLSAPRAPSSPWRARSSRQWHLMRRTRPRRRGPGSSSSALSGLPRLVPLLWQPVWPWLGAGGWRPPAGY